jgi:hypothetical protein
MTLIQPTGEDARSLRISEVIHHASPRYPAAAFSSRANPRTPL